MFSCEAFALQGEKQQSSRAREADARARGCWTRGGERYGTAALQVHKGEREEQVSKLDCGARVHLGGGAEDGAVAAGALLLDA